MAKPKSTSDMVIIKKYANRRLYDTSTSSYVTLEHLSNLVHREVDFEVRDAKSGTDLTRQVLTQIIFERETKGEGALPVNFLRKLIGFYGRGTQALLPAWLEMSINSFAERQEKWTKSVGGTINPLAILEKQTRANIEMFENTMRMFKPGHNRNRSETKDLISAEPAETSQGFSEDAITVLRDQIDAMRAQLDAMTNRKA